MPYVSVDQEVWVDSEEVLMDCSNEELLEELNRRGKTQEATVMASKALLGTLKQMECPSELYKLFEKWAANRLSLSELLALKGDGR